MRAYDLTHVPDAALRRDLPSLNVQQRAPEALILAHIAEYDSRALYLGDGYPSMFAYCVDELRLSEDVAYLRVKVARYARRFSILFVAIAEGRVHLTAIRLLGPYLTPENIEELVAASAGQTKSRIEELIAQRFAHPEPPPKKQVIRVLPTPTVHRQVPEPVYELFDSPTPLPPIPEAPPSEERFEVRFSTSRAAHDRLRYAQSLLSHAVPSGDLEQIYDRAIICLIAQHEKRKFAATEHPGPQGQKSRRKRDVPAEVKRAVWKRDQGRCTFISETGHRCPARQLVEYDHADPVALGGKATVESIRLRCRAHNQYAAERVFGKDFMARQRRQAKERKTKNLPRS